MVHLPASKDGTTMPPLEKPQQILPCPRCESMNTKFCYFNNYSVNQPRHFCKQCQRYWTVGGTLRNVPVGGASRKKNRHPTPQDQQQPYMRSAPPPGQLPLQPGHLLPNMVSHDMSASGYTFSQLLPGFVPPSQELHVDQPLSSSARAHQEFAPPLGSGCSNYTYFQDPRTPGREGVKPEFRSGPMAQGVGMRGDASCVQMGSKSGGYDSSMLLHMGLNSRPLMEEERSARGSGYPNGGFQEGDAVSGSMWHGVHDMQDIFR